MDNFRGFEEDAAASAADEEPSDQTKSDQSKSDQSKADHADSDGDSDDDDQKCGSSLSGMNSLSSPGTFGKRPARQSSAAWRMRS